MPHSEGAPGLADAAARLREKFVAMRARRWLRECTRVGVRPLLTGKPHVRNGGRMIIGNDFSLSSRPLQSHLIAGSGSTLLIGQRVHIQFGAAISCRKGIFIGDDVSVGAFAMIMDSDFHVAGDLTTDPEAKSIHIGQNVRIGHRAIVLPGATVGNRAVVRAGAVVSGAIPAGDVVAGNPARSVTAEQQASREFVADDVPGLVMRVFGLSARPSRSSGPADIPAWDSLGTLRLILALEEAFNITVSEDMVAPVRCVGDLTSVIEAAVRQNAIVNLDDR